MRRQTDCVPYSRRAHPKTSNSYFRNSSQTRGGSRIFSRRRCTHLLLYSTPINHIFFFCRIPVVLENCRSSRGRGVRTPCTLPLDPPLQTWSFQPLKAPEKKTVVLFGGLMDYFMLQFRKICLHNSYISCLSNSKTQLICWNRRPFDFLESLDTFARQFEQYNSPTICPGKLGGARIYYTG